MQQLTRFLWIVTSLCNGYEFPAASNNNSNAKVKDMTLN